MKKLQWHEKNPWKPMFRFSIAYFVVPISLYFLVRAGGFIIGKPPEISSALSWTTAMPVSGLMIWRLYIYLDPVVNLSPEADEIAIKTRKIGRSIFLFSIFLIIVSSVIVGLDKTGKQTPQFITILNASNYMPIVSGIFYMACFFFCLEKIMRAYMDNPSTRQSSIKS